MIRNPHSSLPFAALLCVIALTPGSRVSAQSSPESVPPPGAEPLRTPADVLADPDAPHDARRAAAIELISAPSSNAVQRLIRALRSDSPPGARLAVAEAAARHPDPLDRLMQPLAEALHPADPITARAILAAIARYSDKPAVEAVIEKIIRPADSIDPALLPYAYAALAQQTGRTDLAQDRRAWLNWWNTAQSMRDAEWRAASLHAQTRHVGILVQDQRELRRRLVDTYSRIHRLTPSSERPPLLAELIADHVPELRSLGFELAMLALLNAQPIGEETPSAAARALRDPLPEIRAAAANLLERVDRPDLAPRIAEALEAETDPRAAQAILRALTRFPTPSASQAIIPWIERDSIARNAAIAAAAALEDNGATYSQDSRKHILAAIATNELTASSMRLLVRYGESQRVIDSLANPDPRIAANAANALRNDPSALPAILDAARSNADLFEPAVSALAAHRPTAEGLALAASLPTPSEDLRRTALTAYARRLSPLHLVNGSRTIEPPALREALLAHTTEAPFFGTDPLSGARLDAILLLIRTRLELDQPQSALAAVDAAAANPENAPLLAEQRVDLLLRLNRIDDAARLSTEFAVLPDVWLAAAQRATSPADAQAIARHARTLFADALSPDQRARLDAILAQHPGEEND